MFLCHFLIKIWFLIQTSADFIILKKSICHTIIVLHAFKQCWSKADKERLGNNLVENATKDIFCKRPGWKQNEEMCHIKNYYTVHLLGSTKKRLFVFYSLENISWRILSSNSFVGKCANRSLANIKFTIP